MASSKPSPLRADHQTMSSQMQEYISLLDEHQEMIRCFIVSLLPGAPGVDDVFQETNLVLWRKRDDFTHGTNFRAWAFSIARFQAMAHLQSLKRQKWTTLDPDVAELIADELEQKDNQTAKKLAILKECVEKMPTTDQELLYQRYWTRTRLQDFAVTTNSSVASLKVKLFRLRAALKRCIRKNLKETQLPKH